jgi:gluconolactonase
MRLSMLNWLYNFISRLFPKTFLEAKDPKFLNLFPKHVQLIQCCTGFQFTEGPVWIPEQQCLLFSDIPADQIVRFNPDRSTHLFRQPSQNANGLTLDRQGRLIACEQGTRRLTRTEFDGSITVLSSHFQGKRLNSPNDVVVKSDGSIYFTDPTYGIEPSQQEQPHQGVYRFDPNTNTLLLVVSDFEAPNGLVFSPDEQKLYISDSSESRRHIRVFDVASDGALKGGLVFADLNVDRPGVPDGMTCDEQGNLFFTGAGGVWIFSPMGEHLGTIRTPEIPTNCTWGSAFKRELEHREQSTLYITAGKSIYSIRCSNSN